MFADGIESRIYDRVSSGYIQPALDGEENLEATFRFFDDDIVRFTNNRQMLSYMRWQTPQSCRIQLAGGNSPWAQKSIPISNMQQWPSGEDSAAVKVIYRQLPGRYWCWNQTAERGGVIIYLFIGGKTLPPFNPPSPAFRAIINMLWWRSLDSYRQ